MQLVPLHNGITVKRLLLTRQMSLAVAILEAGAVHSS
jgi:hypothetical protein